MNELKKLREKVLEHKRLYNELREVIKISDGTPYQREGINILSEPFEKGLFTLAVIGEMSAGKSAFINALLEDEDILPTGHFQTTCTLTEIVRSDKKRLVVKYGDGHSEEFTGDSILGKLKEVASINPKFESLPINHIHQFILQGQTARQIISHKTDIIKLSGRPTLDENLLIEYVKGNPKENIIPRKKENIPVHVYLEYPLSDSFVGWRIVDTPGIGALGGIDQTTKDFLINENVDAAIFVFNGSEHIEHAKVSDMVKNAYSQLSSVAKERTFFVITHAGEPTCKKNLERTKSIALDLFSQGDVSIPKERFFAVDSMLSLLYDCAIAKHNIDPMIFDDNHVTLEGMSESELEMYIEMISPLLRELGKNDKELNTENLVQKIIEAAGFEALKGALGDFAKNAQTESYKRLVDTIISDFKAFGSTKNEEKALWSSKLTKTPEEFAQELEKKKAEIEKYRIRIAKEFTKTMLVYGEDSMPSMFTRSLGKFKERIRNATTLADIDNAYDNFTEMFSIEADLVIIKFTSDCKKLGDIQISDKYPEISLEPIDVESAKRKETKDATTTKSYLSQEKKKGFWNWGGRMLGMGGYEYVTKYYDVIDDNKKLTNYKSEVLNNINDTIDGYSAELYKTHIQPTGTEIQNQLDVILKNKNKEYDSIYIDLTSAQGIEEKIEAIDLDILKCQEYESLITLKTQKSNLS